MRFGRSDPDVENDFPRAVCLLSPNGKVESLLCRPLVGAVVGKNIGAGCEAKIGRGCDARNKRFPCERDGVWILRRGTISGKFLVFRRMRLKNDAVIGKVRKKGFLYPPLYGKLRKCAFTGHKRIERGNNLGMRN